MQFSKNKCKCKAKRTVGRSGSCRALKTEALPAAKKSGIDLGFWGKAEEMIALCCLCRTCSESQAKKWSSLEENNTKDKYTEILHQEKGVKKLGPLSLKKRSLGSGKWVVRKE